MNNESYLGYQGHYDIAIKAGEKRKTIANQISEGILLGIIFQFIADVFINIFFSDENVLKNDIEISPIPRYYAAAGSGAITSYARLHTDRYVTATISNTFYASINNFIDALISETEFDIDAIDLVFDIIATEVLLFLFDPNIHNDYLNHYNEKHHINSPRLEADRSTGTVIFLTIITTSFFAYKRNFLLNKALI